MAEGKAIYTEDSIKSLDWKEHIRLRPGMYIGKLGDGSSFDDGIYVLLKEVIEGGITTISTDFKLMGKQLAKMIVEQEKSQIANISRVKIRHSL